MHVSLPIEDSIQFINATSVNPLISHCQIKILYVGENRNKTVISREVAEEMGRHLAGCPIVGRFLEDDQDFEQHSRDIEIKDGKFTLIDLTKPYGFVDINAKVWFQKFQDDDGVIREYLLTEGYIWSDIYPESKRIIEQGNNQSMELNKNSVKGNWTDALNSKDRFFIINEAIIEKLCILGENYEPCFEGAQIKAHFSLNDEFAQLKNAMYSMMQELNLSKGGTNMAEEKTEDLIVGVAVEEVPVVEETPAVEETPVVTEENTENFEKNPDETEKVESVETKETVEEQKYNLEEISEYVELKNKFDTLTSDYAALKEQYDILSTEVEPLKEFKLVAEREKKQAMINKFFMLSDEDKKDVIDNIDSYSLDDIEAKLSVICVRNKVNFNLEEDEEKKEEPLVFNLNTLDTDSDIPDWIKAVKNNI